MKDFKLDLPRRERLGFDEAVFCGGKTPAQIAAILAEAPSHGGRFLLTRFSSQQLSQLPAAQQALIDYEAVSLTGFYGAVEPVDGEPSIAVVCAGTSDLPAAREAVRTLRYYGEAALECADIGVAGLWRLTERLEELRSKQAIIVAAGMEAALVSVVGGLVPGLVIALPTSVGYGVAAGGETALRAALASCAPGVVAVNIDNGYGAACAALRALRNSERRVNDPLLLAR